jgi:hypothetical protein
MNRVGAGPDLSLWTGSGAPRRRSVVGLPSLLIALVIVTFGLLYAAWAINRSHTNARPRVVRATASVPVSAPPQQWPLPLSPLTHHDQVTAAIDPPPGLRMFPAEKSISRGEWQ